MLVSPEALSKHSFKPISSYCLLDLLSGDSETDPWTGAWMLSDQYCNSGITDATITVESLPELPGACQPQFSWKRFPDLVSHWLNDNKLWCQANPALCSTGLNNIASTTCLHAGAKSMGSGAF